VDSDSDVLDPGQARAFADEQARLIDDGDQPARLAFEKKLMAAGERWRQRRVVEDRQRREKKRYGSTNPLVVTQTEFEQAGDGEEEGEVAKAYRVFKALRVGDTQGEYLKEWGYDRAHGPVDKFRRAERLNALHPQASQTLALIDSLSVSLALDATQWARIEGSCRSLGVNVGVREGWLPAHKLMGARNRRGRYMLVDWRQFGKRAAAMGIHSPDVFLDVWDSLTTEVLYGDARKVRQRVNGAWVSRLHLKHDVVADDHDLRAMRLLGLCLPLVPRGSYVYIYAGEGPHPTVYHNISAKRHKVLALYVPTVPAVDGRQYVRCELRLNTQQKVMEAFTLPDKERGLNKREVMASKTGAARRFHLEDLFVKSDRLSPQGVYNKAVQDCLDRLERAREFKMTARMKADYDSVFSLLPHPSSLTDNGVLVAAQEVLITELGIGCSRSKTSKYNRHKHEAWFPMVFLKAVVAYGDAHGIDLQGFLRRFLLVDGEVLRQGYGGGLPIMDTARAQWAAGVTHGVYEQIAHNGLYSTSWKLEFPVGTTKEDAAKILDAYRKSGGVWPPPSGAGGDGFIAYHDAWSTKYLASGKPYRQRSRHPNMGLAPFDPRRLATLGGLATAGSGEEKKE